MEWVMEDLTKSEVLQSWWNLVPRIQKVPLQGFFSVPDESFGASFSATLRLNIDFLGTESYWFDRWDGNEDEFEGALLPHCRPWKPMATEKAKPMSQRRAL